MKRRRQRPVAGAAGVPGAGLLKASWWGTAIFAAVAAAAAVFPVLDTTAVVVAVALFVAGCGLFFAAFARGVGRSRTEQVAVPSLFLLSGSAPSEVRRSLFAALGVQVVVAVAVAVARPYTILAAAVLAPMYGLGLCGLWSARHGRFPARDAQRRPR